MDAKDNLDLIRRKAPSSKKAQLQRQQQQQPEPQQQAAQSSNDGHVASQQIQSLTESLYNLQKQLEELSRTNKHLVSEIVGLQKTTTVQRQAHYELLHYLETSSRRSNQAGVSSVSSPAAGRTQSDELPFELRRARELLASVGPPPPPPPPPPQQQQQAPPTTNADRNVDRPQPSLYPSPADSSSSSAMFVAPDINQGMAVMDGTVAMPRLNVYAPAQPNGMDAFSPDQMQNMRYAVPQGGPAAGTGGGGQGAESARVSASPPTEKSDDWGPNKPHIFLVEDDGVCAKIGMKFIKSFGCTVELAVCFLSGKNPPSRLYFFFFFL